MENFTNENGLLGFLYGIDRSYWLTILAMSISILPALARRSSYVPMLLFISSSMLGLQYAGVAPEITFLVIVCVLIFVISARFASQSRRADRLDEECAALANRLNALEMAEARLQNFTAHSPIYSANRYDPHVQAITSPRRESSKGKIQPAGAPDVSAPTSSQTVL